MTTKRETVLSALFAALQGVGAGITALRNEVLPERIPAGGLLILRDGQPGEPEVTLSPLRYHWQHRVEVEAFLRGTSGLDAAFDALLETVGVAIEADRTLGGLCDWIEADALEPVDLAIEGATGIKAAVPALHQLRPAGVNKTGPARFAAFRRRPAPRRRSPACAGLGAGRCAPESDIRSDHEYAGQQRSFHSSRRERPAHHVQPRNRGSGGQSA